MDSISPHGLINQGATCYLNSVLQLLFMTPELHQALELPPNSAGRELNRTDRVLTELFAEMKKKKCRTESVTEHLQIPDVHQQRDAAEHLELLLNRLSPEVSEPFRGELTDLTQCLKCSHTIKTPAPFWTLPLSVHCSAKESFEQMFRWSPLTDDGFYCEECNEKRPAQSRCELMKPPQILVLLLRRFHVNPRGVYYKSQSEVELSPTLHTQDFSYSLVGAVDHWGDVSGGHYTTTLLSTNDHAWYHFNDETVEKVKPLKGRSRSAYLILYRRNTSKGSGAENRRKPQHSVLSKGSTARKESQNLAPLGLMNPAETCALWLLFMTTELDQTPKRLSNSTETDRCLKRVFGVLKTEPFGAESVTRWLSEDHPEWDAAQSLENILQHMSLKASEPFRGRLTETLECPGKKHKIHVKTWFFWTLELTENQTVVDALQQRLRSNISSGERCMCEKCEAIVKPNVRRDMEKLPQILLLRLTSQSDVELSETSQIQDLSLCVEERSYSLCGVVEHCGGPSDGLYSTTLLSPFNGKWYHCDGGTVTQTAPPAGQRSSSVNLLVYRDSSMSSPSPDAAPPPELKPGDSGFLTQIMSYFCGWGTKNKPVSGEDHSGGPESDCVVTTV